MKATTFSALFTMIISGMPGTMLENKFSLKMLQILFEFAKSFITTNWI